MIMENATDEGTKYKFALVVDGDVGMVMLLNPNEDQLKQADCFRNNPEIVEVDQDPQLGIKFNFVNDGVVNHTMELPDTPAYARFVACLRSNPTILEVEPSNPVRGGWTYDGTDFHPPA